MLLDCISVDCSAFLGDLQHQSAAFDDQFGILPALHTVRQLFRFAFIDIGPRECFESYEMLVHLVRALRNTQFRPRLITSAIPLADGFLWSVRFVQLAELGVDRITLRLDRKSATALPLTNVKNYVASCRASGLNAEIRLEFEHEFPAVFFDVVRTMEETCFYTTIYPVHLKQVECRDMGIGGEIELSGNRTRLVIFGNGQVCLREQSVATIETTIGNLRELPLGSLLSAVKISDAGLRCGVQAHAADV
jgi:hypothetical protein